MDNSIASSTTTSPQIQLSTQFELGGIAFNGYIESIDNNRLIFGRTEANTIVDLITLANSFLAEGVSLPKELPLVFTDLFISANSKGEFTFKAKTASSWQIMDGFSLDSASIDLSIKSRPTAKEREFIGTITGNITLFDVETLLRVDIAEHCKLSASLSEINVASIFSKYAAGVEVPKELAYNNIILSAVRVVAIPQTGTISLKGEATTAFNLAFGDLSLEINKAELDFSKDGKGNIDCSITLVGNARISEHFSAEPYKFSFCYKNGKWSIGALADLQLFEAKASLKGSIEGSNNERSLCLATEVELPLKMNQLLKSLGGPDLQLPNELSHLDLAISGLQFTLNHKKELRLKGGISIGNTSNIQIGEESFLLADFNFDIKKTTTETAVQLSLKGHNLPKIKGIDAQIKSYQFVFEVQKKKEEKTTWKLEGELFLEAFDRLMTFKAVAQVLENEQLLKFNFDSTSPFLYGSYFNGIEGCSSADIMKALNAGIDPENDRIPIASIGNKAHQALGEAFSPLQKESIGSIIAKTKSANEPLIVIPDLLNNNKPLCAINPRSFSIELKRTESKFQSIDFSIGSDLVLYNTWIDQTELFSIKNGVISSGYDRIKDSFYLTFTTDFSRLQPLNAIGMLPGIKDMLMLAFGETHEAHPKTTALVNMLEVQPQGFSFVKKKKSWEIAGAIRLVLNEGLKIVDPAFYEIVESIFPKTGDSRYLEGSISYDSKEGLIFILKNNTGLEIPNVLGKIAESLDTTFKNDFKDSTGIDLEQLMDLGESFVILDQVRLKIAKKVDLDLRIGIGLPSNLNDRLFDKNAKIHGLINTYDREKFTKANAGNTRINVDYDAPFPDDNLMRATLRFGTDGISGQLEKFNLLNFEKITAEFEGLITEKDGADHVVIDLNALSPGGSEDFGKLKIEKPFFKFNFKTYAFTVGGGIEVLSDALKLPVSPTAKKLIGFLPKEQFDKAALLEIADKLTESIQIKSLDFYDSSTGHLNVDDLLAFFKQFLLKEHQNFDLIPPEVMDLLKEHSTHITKLFPHSLLEFLSIKIPKGLRFELEVTADKSVAFALEIPEPTAAQKAEGFSEYLQVLIPDVQMPPQGMHGIKLKKIGLGSALFNNAIRLELSGEYISFRYHELAAGMGMSLIRNINTEDKRLQRMMPDVKAFESRIKLENLFMLIFPQTTVPIPVPLFYDEFTACEAGLIGGKTGLTIKFPMPKINASELIKSLGELVSFFKDETASFSVDSYGKIYDANTPIEDGILPQFHAGPIYLDLPGILGYQKDGENRQPISLGFKDVKILKPKDLFGLAANTAKFGIKSLVEGQLNRIKIDEKRSEYPINYLVKFLPETQRIGSRKLVLFEILEANFAWALSTPGEFKEKVYPLLLSEQQKLEGPKGESNWSVDQLMNIIPQSDKWNSDQDGVVIFLKGAFKISEATALDLVTATALTTTNGIATGIAMRAKLAHLFDMRISGGIELDLQAEKNRLSLVGETSLLLMERVTVLKGNFSMGIGSDSHFMFSGALDLFSDEFFGEERSPIQLYSGTSKGQKTGITGIIDKNGINVGYLNPQGIVEGAGVHLEIGDFHLAGTTKIVTTAVQQEWELKLFCYQTELSLNATLHNSAEAVDMRFAAKVNQPIGIENLLFISGTEEGIGPSGEMILNYPKGSLFPSFSKFYLDGKISLLGMSSLARIDIGKDQFYLKLSSDLGILRSNLELKGKNFADSSCFAMSGEIALINDIAKLSVDANYLKVGENALFKGTAALHFWGKKRMDLSLEAGVLDGNPHLQLEGALDLFLISGTTRLYSGTQTAVLPVKGTLNKNELNFSGDLQFHLNQIYLGGSFTMNVNNTGAFNLESTMSFYAGMLGGGEFKLKLSRQEGLLELYGQASGDITLIPEVFSLEAQSALKVRLNENTNALELFEIAGSTSLLGISTAYKLKLQHNSFLFSCSAALPHADLSFTATSTNLSSIEHLRLSGHVDITKLNAEINKIYEALGIRGKITDKINTATNGKNQLKNVQEELKRNQGRVDFIRYMDLKYRHHVDIHGFSNCVPPLGHVQYWNWKAADQNEVKHYWDCKRELGLSTADPARVDIGRTANAVLNSINDIGNSIANTFINLGRNIVNDLHHVLSDGILKGLNIDTTDLNRLNDEFNKGVNILESEANKWHSLNQKLLSYPIIVIDSVIFKDQSVDLLKTKKLTSTVTAKILGDPRSIELTLDLDDPAGTLFSNLNQFLPSELQALAG